MTCRQTTKLFVRSMHVTDIRLCAILSAIVSSEKYNIGIIRNIMLVLYLRWIRNNAFLFKTVSFSCFFF
jgi:hypothetical protein